jgi:hypothetical protein
MVRRRRVNEWYLNPFCDEADAKSPLCHLLVSLVNLRQRVVKVYFPPPLDVTWRTQRPQNIAEQYVISRASSSWWFISSRNLESTRSTKTTVNTTFTNTAITNTVPGNCSGHIQEVLCMLQHSNTNWAYVGPRVRQVLTPPPSPLSPCP